MSYITIEFVKITASKNHLHPTVFIKTLVKHVWPGVTCLNFRGHLYANRIQIATLERTVDSRFNEKEEVAPFNSKRKQESSFDLELEGQLSNEAIHYMDTFRMQNDKKELILNAIVEVRYISTNYESSRQIQELQNPQTDNFPVPIIKGDSIFEIRNERRSLPFTIPGNDWVQDFLPVFTDTQYFIFEFPVLKV
jgi:hypothetical protein